MWWLYFGTTSRDATNAITRSSGPGRVGAYFHYVHALLMAGIIAIAVGLAEGELKRRMAKVHRA